MKSPVFLAIGLALAAALGAPAQDDSPQTRPVFVSPDGRFGVRTAKMHDSDGLTMTRVGLVEMGSGRELCELGTPGGQHAAGIRLLWSPDSRRFAFVSPSRRGDWTDVWMLKGGTFEKVELPQMPPLDMKRDHSAKTVWAPRSAVRWTEPDVLLVDLAAADDEGNSAKMRVAIRFDPDGRATVRPSGSKDR